MCSKQTLTPALSLYERERENLRAAFVESLNASVKADVVSPSPRREARRGLG